MKMGDRVKWRGEGRVRGTKKGREVGNGQI